MTDVRLSTSPDGASTKARIAALVDDNRRAVNRDIVFGPFSVVFVVAIVVVLALAIASQARLVASRARCGSGPCGSSVCCRGHILAGLFPLGRIPPLAQGIMVVGLGR